ncbi:MAG: hypothetical protein U0L61_04205 [Alistipes sp.]|nr:hypothetical protein [Alistipes sp.]
MKKLHRIVFLILALISVGLMAWAIVVGMQAPDSDKIADIIGLTYQYDENGEEMKDENDNPIPVVSTAQGIESMGVATINQMRKSDDTIYGTTLEKIKGIEAKIAEIEAQLAAGDNKAVKDAEAKVAELSAKSRLNAEEKKELEKNKKVVEDFQKLPQTLADLKAKVVWTAEMSESERVIAMAEAEFKSIQEAVVKANEALEAKKGEYEPAVAVIENLCKVAGTKIAEVEGRADYVATFDELTGSKALNAAQKRELAGVKNAIADYQKMLNDRKVAIDNETAFEANLPMLKDAIAQAELDQHSIKELGKVISYNIYWLYFLLVFAVVFVVVGFILNFFQNSGNLVVTIVAGVVVIAVVAAAYYIGKSHEWMDGAVLYVTNSVGQPILDGAGEPIPFGLGTDPETRTVFNATEYMIADVSIWITYLACAGALLAALYSSLRGIFKS